MDESRTAEAARRIAEGGGGDVLLFNGTIESDAAQRLMDVICPRKRAPRLTMIVVTPGGDPDAAFKMGRALQNLYSHLTIVVSGWCKSAGTLLAMAAHDLVVGDRGELGPLDIQLAKSDEIMELGSGLALDAALKTLETTASRMFNNFLVNIRRDTQGSVTTKTAAEMAARMVTGLLEPIYHQIDPMKIGENSRAMSITKMYGVRLNMVSANLRSPESLEWIVALYPDHSFVVDRTEAKLLFNRVSEPNAKLTSLIDALGPSALMPSVRPPKGGPLIRYLTEEVADEEKGQPANASTKKRTRPRSMRRLAGKRANGSAASDHADGVG